MIAFKDLFSPIKIGSLELKNRIVMAPAGTSLAAPDGSISEALIRYHEARALGGCGLNIVEVAFIDPRGVSIAAPAMISDDKYVPGWRALADAVHNAGGKVFCQPAHIGRQAPPDYLHGMQPASASSVPSSITRVVPHELTVEEIKELVRKYADVARRVREAHLDGIEIHCSHEYLIAEFMSAYTNKRTDEYGGSLWNRMRLPLEIISTVRSVVGRNMPVGVRMSGDELIPGGRDVNESKIVARILEEEGGIDYISISGGVYASIHTMVAPIGTPRGTWVPTAAAIKQSVSIPVMVAGRINDPLFAEQILTEGKADLIGMVREVMADPEWPNKVAAGRLEDIAPCTSCCDGCMGGGRAGIALTCVINPACGREWEAGWATLIPTEKPKKVMVVGGGPGGLETARVAALRGHKVSLYEKSDRLGGQLNLAIIPPLKQEIALWVQYLITQVKKAGVSVNLNTEVTPEVVGEVKPDVVIVATGTTPLIPSDIRGTDKPNVVTAQDVLASKVDFGPMNKVVVVGGGMVGCETADFLAERADFSFVQRREVTIIEMLPAIGSDMYGATRYFLMGRLRADDVEIITSATVKEILDDGLVFTRNGVEETIRGMDTVVLALGAKALDELSQKVSGKVAEVYVIGDAKEPRKALQAIAEGAELARAI